MEKPRATVAKYRINPVELGIFTVTVIVFLNSAYSLLEQGGEIPLTALSPAHEIPSIQSRAPASLRSHSGPSLETAELPCKAEQPLTVRAPKVRFTGKACAPSTGVQGELVAATLKRSAPGGREAQVFVDSDTGNFSTDYLSLTPGKTELELQLTYSQGGKISTESRKVVLEFSL
jgi:hypothetical protein